MSRRNVIGIGGSLGAVDAIAQLCKDLPSNLDASVLIVIHIGSQGNNLLADIFNERSSLPFSTAVDDEPLLAGHAYVAPADHHLLVMDDRIRLGHGPRENMFRPAVDPLFRSLALSFGPRAIAAVLTGLLNDGAAGLADVKRCGGTTVVQNPADAFAPDMPRGALRASDVDYRAPLSDLAGLLTKLVGEEAGLAVDCPDDIKSEVEIAFGRRSGTEMLEKIAQPVALSCPACGGVLSEIRRKPPLRFRCQVGHAYTAEALATRKEGAVEEAIRVSLRIMEERATLTQKLADDARLSGRESAAASYEERVKESRGYAAILQQAIRNL